ncbi:promethin-A-like [Denticeps clupeoides]|uniref:promethin-A-like n=1 Tax=Denticeps clupeoides TaxID=299321 RepID=UPI0010A54704|nr:promethin [Denticeps clupeoides]
MRCHHDPATAQRSPAVTPSGFSPWMARMCSDPRVEELLSSAAGRYLSERPLLALTALLFGAMAAGPTGLFLAFVFVTSVATAVGFVFVEAFLIAAGGAVLLCALVGVALLATTFSAALCVCHVTVTNVVTFYSGRRGAVGGAKPKAE